MGEAFLSLLHPSDSSFPPAPAAAICLAPKILPAHPTASLQTSNCIPSCSHHSFHSAGQTTNYLCLPKVRPFTHKTWWFSVSPSSYKNLINLGLFCGSATVKLIRYSSGFLPSQKRKNTLMHFLPPQAAFLQIFASNPTGFTVESLSPCSSGSGALI